MPTLFGPWQVVITTADLLKNIAALAHECPTLKAVVLTDEANKDQKASVTDAGLQLHSFTEIEKAGEDHSVELRLPNPDDLAILMYTSGTTSVPKGVLITHGNLVACIAGVLQSVLPISASDAYLSYLPLAHILERAAEAAMFFNGASVGFFQGVRY